MEYLWEAFQIKDDDFLTFDAMRQAAQCVGRVICSKADYAIMIFADKRYSCHDKLSELASWILSHLPKAHQTLSTDMALHIAKEFLRKLAQPHEKLMFKATSQTFSEDNLRMSTRGHTPFMPRACQSLVSRDDGGSSSYTLLNA